MWDILWQVRSGQNVQNVLEEVNKFDTKSSLHMETPSLRKLFFIRGGDAAFWHQPLTMEVIQLMGKLLQQWALLINYYFVRLLLSVGILFFSPPAFDILPPPRSLSIVWCSVCAHCNTERKLLFHFPLRTIVTPLAQSENLEETWVTWFNDSFGDKHLT